MNSYNRQTLDSIAKEQGFNRDNLEKVMRLVNILNYFHNNKLLSQTLVLKGGTAINLTVFKLPRLSVDIDLELVKSEVKSFLSNLLTLTDIEKEYVKRFKLREYAPELLFDDYDIVGRVKFHPMALWKTGQH